VIDTATNTEVATIPVVGVGVFGVAITPDGKHAYVANQGSNNVSVIDTASNTVVGPPIPVGNGPFGVAITPDGKHVYVANGNTTNVSVIDTASNTVVGTPIPVGISPSGIAITPDGQHVYVANASNNNDGNVSVIDTATNTVATTVAVGGFPFGVGIMPPPQGVPFLAFSAQLQIHFGRRPNTDAFTLQSSFTLSSTAPAIDPVTQPVTLQVGTFTTTIPPGSFKKNRNGSFTFVGVGGGEPAGSDRAHRHAALRVPCGGTARELDRNQESGSGDADHRRRHGHNLGPGPHFLTKNACFQM
jgi:YVTN family beta-propeller protein